MKRTLRLAVIVSAMASGLFAQLTDVKSTADISKAGIDLQRMARIPARMKEFVDSGTIAGAVTLVARHGVVVSLEALLPLLAASHPLRFHPPGHVLHTTHKPAGVLALRSRRRCGLA